MGALVLTTGAPDEIPFGAAVRDSALAIPLVLLLFGSIRLFPLITALVAGDIVASEDHNGTLKTIFTRSLDRGQIFAGKALAAASYAALALLVYGTCALVAGTLVSGFNPLPTFSGSSVPAGATLGLVAASFAVYLMPIIAVASIGLLLSVITRNSAASVVGTLMISLMLQLVAILPGLDAVAPYLLPGQFSAWTGLLRDPVDWAPVVRAAWVSAAHAVSLLVAAALVFSRRDVAGG